MAVMYIVMFILVVFMIFIFATYCAIKMISARDKEIKTKTFAMKSLVSSAEHLMNVANSNEIRNICKTIYESFKYSDTMSNIALKDVNEQIQREFISFENAVNNKDEELAQNISKEIISLVDKRNKQCKLLK